jgi:hypothetical protein
MLKGTMLKEFLVTWAWHVLGLRVEEMEYTEYVQVSCNIIVEAVADRPSTRRQGSNKFIAKSFTLRYFYI